MSVSALLAGCNCLSGDRLLVRSQAGGATSIGCPGCGVRVARSSRAKAVSEWNGRQRRGYLDLSEALLDEVLYG